MINSAKALFLSILILFSFSSTAQKKTDAKAQNILKKVSSKYKSSKSISANFTILTLDQKNQKTDSQKGAIIVKGDMYRLTLQGQEVICDGNSSWTYIKETNEVQINQIDQSDEGLSPTNIFTIYEKGFSSKYIGDSKQGNIQAQQIELVPDDDKKAYFKILLNISKSENIISSAKIFNKNGTHITYSMDNLNMNKDLPESTFKFDKAKYPGVEVIDLR